MTEKAHKSFLNKGLDFVEKAGNRLPHPATLFFIFSLMVVVISAITAKMGTTVTYTSVNRSTKELEEVTVTVQSLMTAQGLRYIFNSMVSNFTGFAPLGTVLVAIIGIGVCEGSGLMAATLRKVVTATPKRFITAVVVFAGVMSNVASDAGYVILVPLGALVFLSFKRHPIAGLAAAFAGVSGGFSANLLPSTTDPLLSGISTEAAKLIDPSYFVNPLSNYYFMIASTFIITIVGTIIVEKVIEPRLGPYTGDVTIEQNSELTEIERKGLRMAGISALLFALLMIFLTVPSGALLKGDDGTVKEWISKGLVPTIMMFFLIPGIVYGKITKSINNDKELAKVMGKYFSTMGGYLVLVFFAAQFIAYFNYTKLGTVVAVKGAHTLDAIGFKGLPLIVAFVLLSAFINLFMGSASAKWAIMAPVFIPMFMQLGYSPALTQLAYRIGDSSTNIITPLMSYFAMIVAFMQKYDKEGGLGTLISVMLPFSMAFLLFWILLLIVWYTLGLPIGIEGALFM